MKTNRKHSEAPYPNPIVPPKWTEHGVYMGILLSYTPSHIPLREGDYKPNLPNSAGLPIKAKRRMADVAQAKRAAAAAKDEKEKRRKEKSRCPWLKKQFIAKFRV